MNSLYNKICEMKDYTATIFNTVESSTRDVKVSDINVYLAHKRVLMGDCTRYEDILKMKNSKGDEVFDIKKGFRG